MLPKTRKTRRFEQAKNVQSQIREIVDTILWYREYIVSVTKPKTSEDLRLEVERWIIENSDEYEVKERKPSVYLGYIRLKTQENKVLDVPVYVTIGHTGGFQVKYFEKNQIDDIKKYATTNSVAELAALYNVTQEKIKEILHLPDEVMHCVGGYRLYITTHTFTESAAYIFKILVHEAQHCIETVRNPSGRYNRAVSKLTTGEDLTFRDWVSYMSNDNEFYAHLTDMVSYILFNVRDLKKRYKSMWGSMKRKLLDNIQSIINLSPEDLRKEFDINIKTKELPFAQSSINNVFRLSQLLIYTSSFSKRRWKILIDKVKEIYTVVKYS